MTALKADKGFLQEENQDSHRLSNNLVRREPHERTPAVSSEPPACPARTNAPLTKQTDQFRYLCDAVVGADGFCSTAAAFDGNTEERCQLRLVPS